VFAAICEAVIVFAAILAAVTTLDPSMVVETEPLEDKCITKEKCEAPHVSMVVTRDAAELMAGRVSV